MELVLLYLGHNKDYKILKPGATHKARWLMKLLHSMKIVLLEKSLPHNSFGKGNEGKARLCKINKFVIYFVFCYIPWWYTCPIATSAARNDLLFFQTVCDFENIDDKTNRCKDISKAVQKSILNHQWYNVPEIIPLSLFDKGYSFHEKDNLAKKILTFPKKEEFASRDGHHWGKPIFQSKMPSNAVEAAYSADVWNCFPNSWNF